MTCCGCTRPVLLSPAEIALLAAAARAPDGLDVVEPGRRAVMRPLVRMGYLIRAGRSRALATERGRGWLADNLAPAHAVAA